jgi:IS4 transposase
VREGRVRIPTGKILRILTNDLDAPAQEIADLYKLRWAKQPKVPRAPARGMADEGIELFFRWVKQTLKIKKFLGVPENAVRIQIAVALIAFLLLRLAQQTQTAVSSPLPYARLIRANLMHLRGLGELHRPPERTTPIVLGQGVLI